MKKQSKISKKIEKTSIQCIDIGCGAAKANPKWFGVDYRKLPGVDLVQDLEKFPWKIPSNKFDTALASHVVEHINPAKGGFINFMNSVWRILKPGGEFIIGAPYATSTGMFRDPTHINFVNEETWCYFSPIDPYYNGQLYNIYRPLPWKIKINTWHDTGNLEVVLIKLPILKEYNVDPEYLKILKSETNKIK